MRNRRTITLSLLGAALLLAGTVVVAVLELGREDQRAGDDVPARVDPAVEARAGSPETEGGGIEVRETDRPSGSAARRPSVAGLVTTRGGDGIAGAVVRAYEGARWLAARVAASARAPSGRTSNAGGVTSLPLPIRGSARSAEEGGYELSGLEPGDYVLVVLEEGFLRPPPRWVRVAGGETVQADFVLVARSSVRGRVSDPQGRAIGGVVVVAAPAVRRVPRVPPGSPFGEEDLVETVTAADGRFTLRCAWDAGHDLYLEHENFVPLMVPGVPTDTGELDIVLQHGGAITGRAVGPDGAPLGGVGVAAARRGSTGAPAAGGAEALEQALRERGSASGPRARGRSRAEVTVSDGRFELSGLRPGDYRLTLERDGRAELRLDVSLRGRVLDLGDVLLDGPGAISGVVLGPDGKPVVGASVWAEDPTVAPPRPESESAPTGPDVVETNARGGFVLHVPGGGTVFVRARASGMVEAHVPEVTAGAEDVVVDLVAPPVVFLRLVRSDSGTPVEGVLALRNEDGLRLGVSDADGYLEADLPAGPDRLAARSEKTGVFVRLVHPDYALRISAVPLWSEGESEIPVVTLTPRRRAEGRVLDAEGNGVSSAVVKVDVVGGIALPPDVDELEPLEPASSGADGSYSVPLPSPAVTAGRPCRVVAFHPRIGGGTERVPPYGAPAGAAAAPGPVAVDVVLHRGGRVAGTVRTAGEVPLGGARLWLSTEEPLFAGIAAATRDDLSVALSRPDGAYEMEALFPGEYVLWGTATGHVPESLTVSLHPGERLARDVFLAPAASLAGRVVDSTGGPLAGAVVQARPFPPPPDGPVFSVATSRADGQFQLDACPSAGAAVHVELAGFLPGTLLVGPPLPSVLEVVLERRVSLGGEVLAGRTGQPVERFRCELVRAEREQGDLDDEGYLPGGSAEGWSRAVLGRAGRFSFEALEPGTYDLTVTSTSYSGRRQRLELEPGAAAFVEVFLSPAYRLEGRVLSMGSRAPISRARVTISPLRAERPADSATSRDVASRASAVTDPVGRFHFETLPEGRYRISARHRAFLFGPESTAEVDVPVRDQALMDLFLEQGAAIRGRVVLPEPSGEARRALRLLLRRDTPGGDVLELWVNPRDGNFSRGMLPPGSYSVLVADPKDPGAEPIVWSTVDLRAGETGELEIQMP